MRELSTPSTEVEAAGKRHWSMTARLVVGLGLGLSLLWLLATGLSALATLHEVDEVFDSALQETAQRLQPLVLDHLKEHGDAVKVELDDNVAVRAHREYLIYQVRNADGQVLLRSHDAPKEGFPVALRAGFSDQGGQRYYTEVSLDNRVFVQVTEALGHRAEAVWDSLIWLALPLLLLLPLTGMLIIWTVRRGTAPIATLGAAIGARSSGNLAPLLDADLPRELSPIVRDINRLLLRLRQALDHERAFAANSAHELRTPVAAAMAQLQRLLAELPQESQRQRADQVLQSLRRLANLVEKLLQLSRADSGSAMADESSDLVPIIELVLDDYRRQPEVASRLAVTGLDHRRLIAAIDIDAFAIVLRNLIDNALRHGPASGGVELVLDPEGRLHVINGGAIIPAEQLAQLTDRFKRGQTLAAGSGLGLSIAQTILHQVGGRLILRSPASGRRDGFEAVIDLGLI